MLPLTVTDKPLFALALFGRTAVQFSAIMLVSLSSSHLENSCLVKVKEDSS